MFNLIEKIEDWFAWRAYKREYEEKDRKQSEIYRRNHIPLWTHRLREHGAKGGVRDWRELGWVIGEKRVSRYESYKYRRLSLSTKEEKTCLKNEI